METRNRTRDDAGIEAFTNTFLFSGPENPELELVPQDKQRQKKAHRKSRRGCQTCKRRKVKCDEKSPCTNCAKRRETCSLVESPPASSKPAKRNSQGDEDASLVLLPELDPLPNADTRVNLLHMELFHHFVQVTIATQSFAGIWEDLLPQSFHEEYLMTAMLSLSARHLSTLRPHQPRYARAALSLLSKSCSAFRTVLNLEITPHNRDAIIGTSILIYCLAWCNLDFLDGQDPDARPLDLSRDQLFLLSPGVRHVFLMAWQMPGSRESLFAKLSVYQPCDILERILDGRGVDWRGVAEGFVALFDDSRFKGCGEGGGGRTCGSSDVEQGVEERDSEDLLAFSPAHTSDSRILRSLAPRPPEAPHPAQSTADEDPEPSTESYTLLSYTKVVNKLAIILSFLSELKSPTNNPTNSTNTTNQANPTNTILHPPRADTYRYFLSFPIICLGPFLDLIAASDPRPLIVMYHFYRAARVFIGTDETWWAAERAVVMEGMLRRELRRRGLGECLRGEVRGRVEGGLTCPGGAVHVGCEGR